MTTYKIGELFAGAGGMALGASHAGFRHVWANDIDADACSTFRRNIDIEPDTVVCAPVQDFDLGDMSPIDGLAFGFPCNNFSAVGESEGTDGKFGQLYQWGVRALHHFRPSFFVAENVSGLASTKRGNDLKLILSELSASGYDIFPRLYRFEHYDVPQARHRIIIVGFDRELGICFKPPMPSPYPPTTCRDALERPPIPDDATNHEQISHPCTVVDRLRHIRPGENAFTADLPPELQLQMRSKATISQIYRRLDPDRPAYTVTGSGGGGTHMYHYDEPRALTNRERSRLQTFPDPFCFEGGRGSVRKQIGMAVPPVGATHVFKAVLQHLHRHQVKVRS